ncbi:hypothetical protein D8M20_06095 [Corynebacterium propinquum]|nr:MAG: hypothetical protein DI558_03215 [Corynebacterium propinquum]RUP78866.1 hypothetical protein D8M24_06180 [Corynebacterium propinquum]RUP88811.1 hypothetical protein D8M40_06095 [Corynebacterium propinquum]RUP94702.1 hypothetical protein D8M20_06095 [Corynebacterium propinquum]
MYATFLLEDGSSTPPFLKLPQLENVINSKAAEDYRLHTITTASSGSKGLMGGDRIQASIKLTTC